MRCSHPSHRHDKLHPLISYVSNLHMSSIDHHPTSLVSAVVLGRMNAGCSPWRKRGVGHLELLLRRRDRILAGLWLERKVAMCWLQGDTLRMLGYLIMLILIAYGSPCKEVVSLIPASWYSVLLDMLLDIDGLVLVEHCHLVALSLIRMAWKERGCRGGGLLLLIKSWRFFWCKPLNVDVLRPIRRYVYFSNVELILISKICSLFINSLEGSPWVTVH